MLSDRMKRGLTIGALVVCPPVIGVSTYATVQARESVRVSERQIAVSKEKLRELEQENTEFKDLASVGLKAARIHDDLGYKVAVGVVEGEDGRWHGAIAVPVSAPLDSATSVRAENISRHQNATGAVVPEATLLFGTENYVLLVAEEGVSVNHNQRVQATAQINGQELSGAVATMTRSTPTLERNEGPLLA